MVLGQQLQLRNTSIIQKKENKMSKQPLNIMENLAIIPDPAIVDKGFYIPNLTNIEMIDFVPSYEGVIIFNKDTKEFMTFKNTEWGTLVPSNSIIIPTGTSDPINPVPGVIYLNTSNNKLRIFTNAWGTIGIVYDV
jgi:hypothetical protein